MRARIAALAAAAILQATVAIAEGPTARLEVSPLEATLGDPLQARLTVDAGKADAVRTIDVGALDLGPVGVLDGSWSAPSDVAGGRRWVWAGRIAAYEVGTVEVPAIDVPVDLAAGGQATARSGAVTLTVRGVLPEASPGAKAQELADLKPPATVAPDWGPLKRAAVGVAALALLAAVAWWAYRRYAARLRAVPAPADPFRRLPPHVWVYEELGRLLERRLAESGQVDLFFEELSRILKTYLSGRYRVELLLRTTDEVPGVLRQAGAPTGAIGLAKALLEHCDLAKFARDVPEPAACRGAVEDAYRIVDATRPSDVDAEIPAAASRETA